MKENQKVTLIVSAQSEKEHVKTIANECKAQGLRWVHVKLEGANRTLLSTKSVQRETVKSLAEVFRLLKSGKERALLHCAAGIHRTGTCAYSLLRCSGEHPTRVSAMAAVKAMREATFVGVKDWRIDLAEEFLVTGLRRELGLEAQTAAERESKTYNYSKNYAKNKEKAMGMKPWLKAKNDAKTAQINLLQKNIKKPTGVGTSCGHSTIDDTGAKEA
jgi:protein-tyrosine phosphatase